MVRREGRVTRQGLGLVRLLLETLVSAMSGMSMYCQFQPPCNKWRPVVEDARPLGDQDRV